MPKVRIIFIIIGVVILVPVALFVFSPLNLLNVFLLIGPRPPAPEVKYGEFPFRLEYLLNGESVVVEDTLICQFSGYGVNAGVGKYREWTATLASGNERIVLCEATGVSSLYHGDPEDTTESIAALNTVIYFNPGAASYYMGDNYTHRTNFPDALYFMERNGILGQEGVVQADVLLSDFGIELISWEISDPIVNTFK